MNKFILTHNIDLICRAHQVVEDGYEFFCDRKLVTIFSAPNYCGEFDNVGGVMTVSADLVCGFAIIGKKANSYLSTSNTSTRMKVYN